MDFLVLIVLIVCAILAFKVAGVLLKIALWVVIALALYWLVAPFLGLPWPPF
ncbi:hypothetical protein [Coralloluteibacterium stylophorae]|uniref:Uncharacterized protein n=1 Tax=Coralloluteibacterium stylophorae TaxID=1776034 RepID=A0A8J7VWT9_9GAMM|nr:hypothetical protein [Coralloluteibacterium stylophorae]MBS7457497.1 hypothetical protein [Coralloluteibacterium stylophorae]